MSGGQFEMHTCINKKVNANENVETECNYFPCAL